ncbi:MAG: SH3 domain-containing protein [Actinomycetota bacterium]
MTDPLDPRRNPLDPSSAAPFDPEIDPSLDDTARRVAEALNAYATTVEPSADAYARLATSVAAARTRTEERSSLSERLRRGGALSGGRGGQLGLVASMAAVAALGVGAMVVFQGTAAEEVTSSSFPAQAQVQVPVETETIPSTTQAPPEDSGPVFTSPEAGPDTTVEAQVDIGQTPEQAVRAFLDAVEPDGRADVVTDVVIDGPTAVVVALGADGEPIGVIAELQLVEEELGGGSSTWRVQGATSPLLAVDRPAGENTLTSQAVRVTGTATGVPATDLEVVLISTFDGRTLATVPVVDPSVDPEPADALVDGESPRPAESDDASADPLEVLTTPFSVRVPLANHTRAWLVVRSTTAEPGTATPFAARLVSVEAVPEATAFRVIRIPADDPDGGLNLRAEPGLEAERLVSLPVGSVVLRRAGLPVDTGERVWWPVTAGGVDGWVASAYLGGGDAEGQPGARATAEVTLAAATGGALPVGARPFTPGGTFDVVVDGTVHTVDADSLRMAEGWSAPIEGLDRSLLDVLGPVPAEVFEELAVERGRPFVDPRSADVADGWFGGLPIYTVRVATADGERLHHWVLDGRANGSVTVLGVIVEDVA